MMLWPYDGREIYADLRRALTRTGQRIRSRRPRMAIKTRQQSPEERTPAERRPLRSAKMP
jgi:hypothetical protein